MVKKSSKVKSNIKVRNKKLNKLNKGKRKGNKKTRKFEEASKKGTNLSLAYQKAIEEQEENVDEDEAVLPDDMLDDETLEYIKTGFDKKRKRKHVDENNDDKFEKNYKRREDPVSMNLEIQEKSRKPLLPIKTKTGIVKQYVAVDQQKTRPNGEKILDKLEIPKKTNGHVDQTVVDDVDSLGSKSAVELILEQQAFIENTKLKIGLLSHGVMENPQEEMKKLRELRTMLTQPEIRNYNLLKKLIIVSLTEIFKDILPGYKIRVWSEKEKEQQVSKDIATMKDYEHTLVKQYKLFLDYLESCVKGRICVFDENKNHNLPLCNHLFLQDVNKYIKEDDTNDTNLPLSILSLRCLCNLIDKLSYFNHAPEIIEIIVRHLNSQSNEISSMCNESIGKLFRNDKELNLSLEITRKIAKMLKQKSYGVKEEVLNTFLQLNLKEINVVEDEKKKKLTHKDKMKLSRADRKKLKEKEQLEMDLEEKKSADKLKSKATLQSQILEQLFFIYFNILKKFPNYKLIPCVLEGLSKFAHLISIDYFEDLITVMHDMIESDRLTSRAKLHSIKTVFVVLSGQGESLTIDPLRFYNSLYNILLKLNATETNDNAIILADCIDMMFIKRRKQVPTARLLAFIKRLTTISLQSDTKSNVVYLQMLRKLITLNKSIDLLYDPEYQYSGIYNGEVTEPDYANAQNTSLWELHLLRRHYDQTIREMSNKLLNQTELTFQESERKLADLYGENLEKETEMLPSKIPQFAKQKNAKKPKNKIKTK